MTYAWIIFVSCQLAIPSNGDKFFHFQFFRFICSTFDHPSQITTNRIISKEDNTKRFVETMKFTVFTIAAIAATTNAFVQRTPFTGTRAFSTSMSVTKDELAEAQKMIDGIVTEKSCGPVMVRLAWHDSGTFDASIKGEWPAAGGAIASIRFAPEINHGANAGLAGAAAILEPVKEANPSVSYADIYQMASARSIELAGGPKIDMKYGRVDAADPAQCSPEGNLPDAEAGDNGEYGGDSGTASTKDTTPNGHLRKVFYRMGLNDEEIVALSGAHTFGRAYKERSGLGAENGTKFTNGSKQVRVDGSEAKYTPGGSSWTEKWLIFDNSYFITMPDPSADPELLKLSSDKTIFQDEGFKPFAESFRDSQDAFFVSYAKAHKKLSELGSSFEPAEGITSASFAEVEDLV
jgi:L-ascorbate peroxidase